MAGATMSSAMMLAGKRKRTHVTYNEDDEELDALLEIEHEFDGEVEAVTELDEDASYGSRRKPKRKLAKRARFSSKPQARKASKPFPFLSLPPELRDYIYELALNDAGGITLVSKTKSYRRTVARGPIENDAADAVDDGQLQGTGHTHGPNQLIPNLLAVNKQIYSEAIGYLYMQPVIVEDTYALHSFLATIGSHRSKVTNIIVRNYGCGRGTHKAMNFCAFTLLATCVNLRSIFLDCEVVWDRTPKNLARRIYRDANYFLNEVGLAKGRRDAAIDLLQLNEWNFDRSRSRSWYMRTRNVEIPGQEGFKREFQTELRKLLRC